MTKRLDLYSFADVDRSGKVRWTACELGYEIGETRVDLGGHRGEDYLQLNPYGQIPTVVIDGETWIESTAICILLAERHPDSMLIPADGNERSRFWQSVSVSVTTLELPVVNYYLASRGFAREGWQDMVGESISGHMRVFAASLPEEGYLCGGFSLADIFAAYVLRIAVQAGILPWEGKQAAYLELLRKRPAAVDSRVFDSLET